MKAVRTVESIQHERAAKGTSFAAFRQKLNLQVPLAYLPLGKRPIHQLQSKPKVWSRFFAGQRKYLRSFGGHTKTQEQRVVENLSWPADEVWSIQYEISEEFSCLLHERGTRNLFASCLESTWVDAEALTEGDLRKVSNLCSKIAPDAHFDESYPDGAIVVTLGDEPCVLMQSLIGGGDQWEAPTHEISNLLNRRLFPQRVAIYLYPNGESGTYVIVERDRASEILKCIHKGVSS